MTFTDPESALEKGKNLSEQDYRSQVNRERVTVVDEDNRVVGSSTRLEVRREGLVHRATYILVFNGRGELYIHRRTMWKDIYPGYYCVSVGGVVAHGETYEVSAKREVAEELGI